MRDALGDLAALAYRDVIHDPIVQEGGDGVPALIADLGIRGIWLPQIEALFDLRFTDADAPYYMSRSAADVLVAAEDEKKKKCLTAAEVHCASFSPFVVKLMLMGHWGIMLIFFMLG